MKADADRTRSKEMPNKAHLEKILTFYCKQHGVRYKQGLNDVLAPFLLLWHENRDEYALHFAYNCMALFIQRFLPTFYLDDDFNTF